MKMSRLTRSARWMIIAAAISTAAATPEPGPSGDADIADFAQMDIGADRQLLGCKVEVSVDDGIATLSGTALSLDQAERAAARAMAIDQVRAVVNRIEIVDPVADDAILAERLTHRLKISPLLDASRVRVGVNGRRAVLAGEIGSWDEQELAREIASETQGIKEIDNRLEVTFDTIRTDRAIRAQIHYLVSDDPLYDGVSVNVEVEDGVVRLAGVVGSTGEKNQLVHRAHVTGVTEVWADDIMIDTDLAMEGMTGKVLAPETLLESLRDALEKDSRLENADVRARLEANVLTLTGTAPSSAARAAAESTARGLAGGWFVANEIRVTDSPTARHSAPVRGLALNDETP